MRIVLRQETRFASELLASLDPPVTCSLMAAFSGKVIDFSWSPTAKGIAVETYYREESEY